MNLRKYIKFKGQPPLTEKEQELYNSLVEQVERNAASGAVVAKTVHPWKFWAPAAAFVCVIAVVLTCVFTLRPSGELTYNDENTKIVEATFTDLKDNIKYFDLSYIEAYRNQSSRAYDTVSNDNLYYRNITNIDLTTINMVVVINEKYEYKFDLDENVNSQNLSDYTLTYSSKSSRGDPQINYKGYIKFETETVYFDYVQVPASGDEAFFESIQQIIKVKK